MKLPSKIYLLVTMATSPAMGASESRITQFLDPGKDPSVVVIAAGSDQGVIDGSIFQSFRTQRSRQVNGEPVTVQTGELKAFDVKETYSLARVTLDSTPMARAFFPKFPGVMAGDRVVEKPVEIAKVQALTPETLVRYSEVFVDPKPVPRSFEISSRGEERLKKIAEAFAFARLKTLLIEGHTDANGPSAANQVESYQRALTAKQYLVSKLGFDSERVVVVGFGEAEPIESGYAPGYRDMNRRLIFKVMQNR